MTIRHCLAVLVLVLATAPVSAHDAQWLGVGRLLTNDFFGDGRDRWQSGSHVTSILRGHVGADAADISFAEVLEYRLRTAIIAPDGFGSAPDRPYVGALSFGLHSHMRHGNSQARVGFDLTVIGPQTGLSRFQRDFHDAFEIEQVRFTDQQLGNNVFLGASAEVAENVQLTPDVSLRPFAEVQYRPEKIIRVGADLIVGGQITEDVVIRDVTTGHLYQGTHSQSAGDYSFVLGADVAWIANSAFLPATGLGAASDARGRIRAGVHLQANDHLGAFYGVTYLSPEFRGQSEGQVVGSVTLVFNF